MQIRFPLIFLLFLLTTASFGQTTYPADYFRSPVDTTIALAGNFGEIRPNHFHAGFDIKTNNHEGMKIYAAADGYISRIKISPVGYGNALYITHPNGYTSVYGHLKSFDGVIAAFTKTAQYALQSFELDTLLSPAMLPVTKGQLIALSGNTGGSQGPHLHFEIRETATEKPVNPYFFGFVVPDEIKPKITEIVIYPLGENALVNGKSQLRKIKTLYKNGKYSYASADTINVSGEIGFGIECYDTENKSTNQNGVYSIELQSGGKRIFYYEMEKFSFENARYVNAHIDYPSKQKHGTKIQKCFVSKNNQIGIYKDVINSGVLNFTDDSVHWIRYIVKDFVGNTTELMIKVKSSSKMSNPIRKKDSDIPFDCSVENKFNSEDVKIIIPAYALYEDVVFTYSKPGSAIGTYSPTHLILNDEVALQKNISLSIKPVRLPDSLFNKACIVSINAKGGKSYEGGAFADGWVTTQTKEFGNYAVGIDTIPPKLKPAFKTTKYQKVNLSKAKRIGIIATDNLSGIREYSALIDGRWVLLEYEFKQNLLFYTFDASVSSGEHVFNLEVKDGKGNSSVHSFNFIR